MATTAEITAVLDGPRQEVQDVVTVVDIFRVGLSRIEAYCATTSTTQCCSPRLDVDDDVDDDAMLLAVRRRRRRRRRMVASWIEKSRFGQSIEGYGDLSRNKLQGRSTKVTAVCPK